MRLLVSLPYLVCLMKGLGLLKITLMLSSTTNNKFRWNKLKYNENFQSEMHGWTEWPLQYVPEYYTVLKPLQRAYKFSAFRHGRNSHCPICISIPTVRRVELGFTPSILNTETRSSETTVWTFKTTQYRNAEDYNLSIQFSYLALTSIGKVIRCSTNRSDSTSRLLRKDILFLASTAICCTYK